MHGLRIWQRVSGEVFIADARLQLLNLAHQDTVCNVCLLKGTTSLACALLALKDCHCCIAGSAKMKASVHFSRNHLHLARKTAPTSFTGRRRNHFFRAARSEAQRAVVRRRRSRRGKRDARAYGPPLSPRLVPRPAPRSVRTLPARAFWGQQLPGLRWRVHGVPCRHLSRYSGRENAHGLCQLHRGTLFQQPRGRGVWGVVPFGQTQQQQRGSGRL